jgi:hypothetical protein
MNDTALAAEAAAQPTPTQHITTVGSNWFDREVDEYLPLDDAIRAAKDLEEGSKAQDMDLGEFRLVFSEGNVFVEIRDRNERFGSHYAIRYRLNHWSFQQTCTLLGARSDFMRKLPGDMACDVLNYLLMKRNDAISVYRTHTKVQEIPADTVRSITSRIYARLHDRILLDWVKETGYDTSRVAFSDRGVSVTLHGEFVSSPDGLPVRLDLILENSEVGASSVKAVAAITRAGLRIPITLAGARVRHVGDVMAKAVSKLESSRFQFENVDRQDLANLLRQRAEPDTRTRGEWYRFLKSFGIGKYVADKILPASEEGSDEVTTSRWTLAVKLATRAAKIPYFDNRLEAELLASKVLGV